MTFLLDTNVLSELRRIPPEPAVAAWARAQNPSELYVSAITIMEIRIGMLRMARRDPVQARMLEAWIETRVLPSFDGRILPVDTAVAWRCAELHVPDPSSERDAMIAATALVHELTVVTRNTTDFASTGVRFLNPWR